MKYLLSLILLLLGAGSSSAQLNVWRWQNPLPEGYVQHSVHMVSLEATYACGEYGSFMRTSDGGVTWDLQINVLKLKSVFNCISFLDPSYGMICGDSGRVLKTTDGGTSWTLLDTSSREKLNSITVVDKNIALMVTDGGGISKTTDGGNTWKTFPLEGVFSLYSINQLRPNFLTVCGYGGSLYKSVDTGRTWQKIETGYGNNYFSARFADESGSTIIGDHGLILTTIDGGASWDKQVVDSFILTATLNMVDGKDPNIYAAVGDYGTIIYTTDGGKDWLRSDIGTVDHVKAISFYDKLNATAVGRDGIVLRTTDAGQTWVFLPQRPATDLLYCVAFPKGDTSLGIAAGYYGAMQRTTNGGKDWVVIQSGTVRALRGICFMDSSDAIAVGDYGTIIKTTDKGLTWNSIESETNLNLYSVSFATPNIGLIVGDSTSVLRTYSAGQFWTKIYAGADTNFLTSVSFPDPMHAFISGFYGFYSSEDGGVDWKFIAAAPNPLVWWAFGYHGLSFADSLHGAILEHFGPGGGPIIYWYVEFTSDGGMTWNSVSTPNNLELNGVYCVDDKHTTVVGKGGYIGHSSDGGITVNPQQSNTPNDLYAVSFGTLLAGTAVGHRGNIMRITTDETNAAVREQGASGSPQIIIEGNYPNPFSTSTIITYHLPASGYTTIEIFSIDGESVARLANEYESSGEHTIHFDGTGLASGTYLCKITSVGMSTTGKLKIEN